MNKFFAWMEKYFVPVAGRIGAQRHLVAIRDGFVGIMPLILAGSLAVLLNNTVLNWIPALGDLKGINGNVWWGSLAIMTLLVVFSVGYNLARGYNVDGLAAGLVSVGAFIAMIPQVAPVEVTVNEVVQKGSQFGLIGWSYLNATGLFTGLIVALIATEIFVKLVKANFVIKLPENVPPSVGKAFIAVIPGIVSIYVFGILAYIITKAGGTTLYDLILKAVQTPLQGFGQGVGSAVFLAMLINLFWFFGLHGANILDPIMNTLYLPALTANADAIQAGQHAPFVITRVFFDAFVHLGGSGATLALILAIFIVSKKRIEYKEVSKLAVPAGIFQINEPMIFGIPIVLNPILFIPFIITPGILTFIAWAATASGIVPATYVVIPWIMPVGLGGFFATGGSIMGALLALVNFCVAVLIYIPFVKMAENQVSKE